MTRIRTFIAVDTSPAVRRRAVALQDKLREGEVNASWTDPENMHVTMQFLGDVDESLIPEVCQRVAVAAAPFAPFDLEFARAGAFPALDRPRTVWIGVDRGSQKLVELQFAIQESLVEMRFPRERRTYKPHLTIARVRAAGPRQKRLSELIAHYHDFKAESCDVTEVVIFASYLERSGPTYQIMGRAPLAG
ncbi:MAG: RNA 2',3'-cyclic phosphodiesterase [Planctomycetota bacterium]|nr:RNA 2',3'-cyclic phosphodiesterase [Planctomycetota bacterium]